MSIMLILIRPTGCGFHEFLRVGAGGFGMPETQTCSPQNSVELVQSNSESPPVNPLLNSQSLRHASMSSP